MQTSRAKGQPDYTAVTMQLAGKALAMATDSAPHRAREGELRWPIANALPAARVLVGQAEQHDHQLLRAVAVSLNETLAEDTGKITDGFGHARPSYGLLAIHLLGSAAHLADQPDTLDLIKQAAVTLLDRNPTDDGPPEPRLAFWRRLIARQHGLQEAEELPLPNTGPAPLVPLGLDDLIDSWTYYELVGLHGLHLCNLVEPNETLAQQIRSVAEYHLGHTQPDYTTYQPWGLAAFASDVYTAMFAEQQLHDVATHLSIEGPGGAVLPALLLADNAAAMSGTLSKVWRRD
ncbi:MAG: hypothetical protein AB8C95_05695 [Phycisphaeraceae bacterium]